MKTVIHLIDRLARGGAERVVLNSVNSLKRYHNIVVLLRDHNIFRDQITAPVHCLHYDKREWNARQKAASRLRDLVRQCKASVVHAHLPTATQVARMAGLSDCKLVFTVQNNYRHKFLRKPILFLREKRYYRRDQVGIFVSEDARRCYDRFIGLKGESHVLHNFVDDMCYSLPRYEYAADDSKPLSLVATGNLRHQKNHIFLIRALRGVDKSRFRLTIYGDGGTLRRTFEREIAGYGLQDNIFLPGSVPNEPLLRELVNHDLYVMSSIYEGFSLALSEAVILGMPCLLSDIAPSRENAQEAALYYKAGSIDDFLLKLNTIIENRGTLQALHRKAVARRQTLMTADRYVAGLEKIYG